MNAKLTFRLASVVAVVMMLTTMAHAEWRWSGYTQIRYDAFDGDYGDSKPDSDFLVRRARIKLEGDANPDTLITLQVDLAGLVNNEATTGPSNIALKDALITRKLGPQRFATLGYTAIPFGYEVPTSDAVQLPLERSQAASKFFPGERDTGLYYHYRPVNTRMPQIDLGYSNGVQDWYTVSKDNKDSGSHAFEGRAQWPLKNGGVAGVSYYAADRDRGPAGGALTDFNGQNTFGAHLRYVICPNWTVQGEYYDGKVVSNSLVSQDANGWYGLASYKLSDKPVTAFYRYDQYDQDGQTSTFQRSIAGVAWDRSKTDRATFQVEDITNDGSGNDYLNFYAQYQVKY